MATDFQWLKDQLSRYTYRPGWSFTLIDGSAHIWSPPFMVEMTYEAQNAYNPTEIIPMRSTQAVPSWIPECRDPLMFRRFLQQAIFETEMHESREWLRLDGELVDDPHKGDKRSTPLA